MSTLFISHRAADKDNRVAKEIVARLGEQEGHESIFLDLDPEKGIVGGRSWEQTLYRKVRACRAVVALLSNDYLKSHWCFAELALSRMECKHLIALEIEELDPSLIPQILTGVQRINYHADPEDGYGRLLRSLEELDLLGVSGEWNPKMSPYLGLRTFEEKHASLFFGRGEEASEGVRLLGRGAPGLFMVLGSSGSGKSSLVRAGMIPRLRREADRWLIVGPFRPRRDPFAELADALAEAWERYVEEKADTAGGRVRLRRLLGAGPTGGAEPGPATALDNDERVHRLLAQLEELAGAPPEGGGTPFRSFLDLSLEELRAICAGEPVAAAAAPPSSGAPLLVELAKELRHASGHKEASVLLIIDQFEELLGSGAPADAAGAFLGRLREGIEYLDRPLMVLGTMRSDFLELFQRNPELQGIDFQKISVGPMNRQSMRQVIKEPARLGAVEVSDELVERLLDDTGTPDALPLLSFTLAALWEQRDDQGRLSADRYELMGGLHGAVAREAQEILESLEPGQQDQLREAFLEMARTEGGRYARRPVSWTDEKIARVEPVLRRFVDRRLLVTSQEEGGESTVEVAHEALFRSWPPLAGWLDRHRSEFLLKEQLERDAEAWLESDRPQGMLWRGGRLQQAVELREGGQSLNDAQAEFIRTSDDVAQAEARAEEERRRRELEQAQKLERAQRKSARIFKRAAALIGLALVVVAGFLWYAVRKKREAEDQTRVAVARHWLREDPTRAALVLLEVRDPEKTAYTVELMSEALREPLAIAELRGHQDQVTAVDFDPEGGRIVSASTDRTARVWRLEARGRPVRTAGGQVEPVLLAHPDHVLAAAFSPPDGRRVVTGCRDGAARIWNADGSPFRSPGDAGADGIRAILLLHERNGEETDADASATDEAPVEVRGVAFSPDGRRIVTGASDGTVRIWSADPGADGPTTRDGALDLLDLKPLVSKREDGTEDPSRAEVNSVDFSSDGEWIVAAVNDKTAWLWNPESGATASLEPRHGDAVFEAVFARAPRPPKGDPADGDDAESDRIVTASKDNSFQIWRRRADGGFEPHEPGAKGGDDARAGHGGDLYGVAASPAGDRIVTVSDDRTALVWDADGKPVMSPDGSRRVAFRHEAEITSVALDAAGGRVATGSKDFTVRIWELAGGLEPVVLPPQPWVNNAIIGRDGEILVASTVAETEEGPPYYRVWGADRLDGAGRRFDFPVPFEDWSTYSLSTVFSPTADRIVTFSVSGSAPARLWLWHPPSAGGDDGERSDAAPLLSPDGKQVRLDPVVSAAFCPTGDRIVTASSDGRARLLDADGDAVDHRRRQIVLDHGAPLVSAACGGPRGEKIVTAAADGTVKLWRSSDGSPLRDARGRPVVLRLEDGVSRAVLGPAGQLVATTSGSSALLWHADGRPLASEDGGRQLRLRHDHIVLSLEFSRRLHRTRGARIVTGSLDETARIWSLGRGEPIVLRGLEGWVVSGSFAPEGDRVIIARESGALVWRLSRGLLEARTRAATGVCLDPGFRENSLREKPDRARARHDRCRRCLDAAYPATGAASPTAAFEAYSGCLSRGLFTPG